MVSKAQEEKILKETKELINLFLKTNASDIELSKITGISSSTIGRRLINKKYIEMVLTNVYGKNAADVDTLYNYIINKRQENLLNGKKIGGYNSVINNTTKGNIDKVAGKLNLKDIYETEEEQIRFLGLSALTFRLHLDTINYLFNINDDVIIKMLEKVFPDNLEAFTYLFQKDNKSQDIAINEFLDYYSNFYRARIKKDIKTINTLIRLINDKNMQPIMEKKDKVLTIDMVHSILNYELKYALSKDKLINIFNLDIVVYEELLEEIFVVNPELKDAYINLENYCINNKGSGLYV